MKKVISSLIALFMLLNINCQVIDYFPYLCKFDNNSNDNWFNVENGENFYWLTSSDSDSHVFVTSLSDTSGKQAFLEAEVDLRSVKKAEIIFIYKIQTLTPGIEPGVLQLDLNHKGKWIYDLWHKHSSDLKWKKQKIDLSEYCGESVLLSFTGYLKTAWSEICLDNILITAK